MLLSLVPVLSLVYNKGTDVMSFLCSGALSIVYVVSVLALMVAIMQQSKEDDDD